MIISKRKKDNIATIMIIIFNMILFLRQYIAKNQLESNVFSMLALAFGCLMIIYTFIFGYDKKKLQNVSIFYMFFYLFGVISSLFNKNYQIQDYFIPFQYFGVGVCLLIFKLNYKAMKYNFYILIIFFIINIIFGTDPAKLFNISRNYISVVLLIYLLLYYISCFQNNVKISIIPTVFCCLISLWAVGRGGIVTFFILLILIYFYNNFHPKFSGRKFIIQTGVIALIGIIVIYFFYSTIISNALSRFDNQGMDSGGRDLIWEEYFEHIEQNTLNFIFGVPTQETEVLNSLDGNPHNAFFYLHLRFGIAGFLMVSFIMVCKFLYLYKKNKLYAILLFIVIVRIFTDSGAYNGPFDPFLYYFLFIKINKCNYVIDKSDTMESNNMNRKIINKV